jgi:taurine transport system permease protein
MIILSMYIAIFAGAYFIVSFLQRGKENKGFNSLKTVTFGDESAVTPNRAAAFISVITIFLIWGAFTDSRFVPFHVSGPFVGDTSFTYTAKNAAGVTEDANVSVRVHKIGDKPDKPEVEAKDGFAQNDSILVGAWRSKLINVKRNDEGYKEDGYQIVAINGKPIAAGESVEVDDGRVALTEKNSLNFTPTKGEIAQHGYQNFGLWEHLGWSLIRVIVGFVLGALVGIPLGYAMGLSGWFRGWFDPIVEFMRPVPPLALIPLVIIWFGIWETGKIVLLFLASLWIMTIAARAGVSGINISKVHAAYSLGASKRQLMWYVIVPNSLPEIFTGARVAMGVCWGTVVAAELVAAQKGAGMMIIAASKFQLTDIVLMGIIMIGIIGYGIDILMRKTEKWLVPWKGKH